MRWAILLYAKILLLLLIGWRDRSTPAPILNAAALGWLEFCLAKPMWSPDEQFHRVITGSLEEWWREQGGQFEAVTVIGDDPSTRVHEMKRGEGSREFAR